jgi:hypothetical protein
MRIEKRSLLGIKSLSQRPFGGKQSPNISANIRLPYEAARLVEDIADQEQRPFSQVMRILVLEALLARREKVVKAPNRLRPAPRLI